jgi:hypothetical protein
LTTSACKFQNIRNIPCSFGSLQYYLIVSSEASHCATLASVFFLNFKKKILNENWEKNFGALAPFVANEINIKRTTHKYSYCRTKVKLTKPDELKTCKQNRYWEVKYWIASAKANMIILSQKHMLFPPL